MPKQKPKLESRVDTSRDAELRIGVSIAQNEERLKKIQEERAELLKDEVKNQKKLNELRDEQYEIQHKIKKEQDELSKISTTYLEDQQELNDLSRTYEKTLKRQRGDWRTLSDDAKGFVGSVDKSAMMTEHMNNILRGNVTLHQKQHSLSDSYIDLMRSGRDYTAEHNDNQKEILSGIEKANVGEYTSVDLSTQKNKLLEAANDFELKKSKMSADERANALSTLAAMRVSYQQNVAMNDALVEASKNAKRVLSTFDSMMKLDIKGALRSAFKLDEINDNVKKNLRGALVNVVKEIRGEGGLVGGFKAAGEGLGALIHMAPKLLIGLGIGAILMLGKFLIDTFFEADKEVAQLGKDLGISKNEAKEVHHEAVEVANQMKIVGINSEQVAKSIKTVGDTLGGVDISGRFAAGDEKIVQMVKDATILTEKFGLSGEEVDGMSKNAAILGMSVGEASNMAVKLGNGIFNAKDSMKLLAGIPPNIVSSMKKMPQALMNTAIQAKLLGLNMQKVADIGRKSLDIETSLENEMEARALLGKDINLDKMRAAALDGDQETVMKELLNAAGSMAEFNDMNVIQKEALAKAAGMEVDELANMLSQQEKLNDAGLSQKALTDLQKKNSADLTAEAKKLAGTKKGAFLEELAAQKKSEETQAAMASLMKRLQELAVKLVTPIMDVVDGLLQGKDGADAMGGILNTVGGVIKMMVPGIKLIAYLIGLIAKPLISILGLFASTEEQTDAVAHTTGKVADGVQQVGDKVKPLTSGFGSLLGIVTMIGGFFAGKALLGKGMDLLKDKATDLGKTLISKVGGPLGKIGGKLFGGGKKEEAGGSDSKPVGEAEKGKNIVSGILDKTKAIIDSLKGLAQSAISFLKEVAKDLLSTLNDVLAGIGEILSTVINIVRTAANELMTALNELLQGLGDILETGFEILENSLNSLLEILQTAVNGIGEILQTGVEIIVDVGTKLAEGAMKILNIIMKGLAQAAATLPGIMASLGSAVVAFFTPMAALLPLAPAILLFTAAMIGLAYAFKLLGEGIGAAAPGITAFFDGVGTVVQAVGEAIAKIIETITTSVIRLQDINGAKLLQTASGIVAIGGALAALGAGKAAEGFGSFVGTLFGGDDDPLEKLISFTDRIKPEKILATADSMKVLGNVFKSVADSFQILAQSLDKIDIDKLDSALEKLKEAKELNDMSIGEGIVKAVDSFVGGVGDIIGSVFGDTQEKNTKVSESPNGNKNSSVEKKLDTLISVLSQAANQPLVIKFGDKVVDEIKTQLNFKNSGTIGLDNTYGRSI